MRIGMVLDTPFPPDPRVANEARSLIAAGHEVYLFCLNLDGPAEVEDWEGICVVRYPMSSFYWKKLRAVILTVGLYNRWLRKRLKQFIDTYRIEALHMHDLPIVGEGLAAAGNAGIPLIADLHENYPAAIRLYAWSNSFLGKLLVNPTAWDAYERHVVPQADRVIVVIDEATKRLPAYGVNLEQVTVVENTVAVDEFEQFPSDDLLTERLKQRFVVTYTGGFDRHRGLETMIDAAAIARDDILDLQIVLVGRGATEPELKAQARALGVEDIVSFEGWQSFSKFPSYIRGSSVCVIPHLKTEHTDTTIPHKLFHYMLLEKPVVSTDCDPLKRIVDEAAAGLIYPSGDAKALAKALVTLRDEQLRQKMGQSGRAAVLDRYRWDQTAEKLVALYASL
jgi:glycosyltransferase involved in cell wall biosynthesis